MELAPRRHVAVDGGASVGDALAAARAADASLIVVVHEGDVFDAAVTVEAAAEAPPAAGLSTVVDLDPPTAGPDVTARDLLRRVRSERLPWVAVTTAHGRFVGAVDGEALAGLARSDRLP